MGIIIHSLESVSFKDLYAAFSSAFKDYDFSLNADGCDACSTDEDTIHNYLSGIFRRTADFFCLTEQACTTTS